MRVRLRFVVSVAVGFLPLSMSAQRSPESRASDRVCSGVYSAVRLVPEVDDYVGSEILFWRCTLSGVAAEWRLYEGGHEPQRIPLEGAFVGGQLVLHGRVPGGPPVEIRATFRGRTLTGTAAIGAFSKVALKLPKAPVTWAERVKRR